MDLSVVIFVDVENLMMRSRWVSYSDFLDFFIDNWDCVCVCVCGCLNWFVFWVVCGVFCDELKGYEEKEDNYFGFDGNFDYNL